MLPMINLFNGSGQIPNCSWNIRRRASTEGLPIAHQARQKSGKKNTAQLFDGKMHIHPEPHCVNSYQAIIS